MGSDAESTNAVALAAALASPLTISVDIGRATYRGVCASSFTESRLSRLDDDEALSFNRGAGISTSNREEGNVTELDMLSLPAKRSIR